MSQCKNVNVTMSMSQCTIFSHSCHDISSFYFYICFFILHFSQRFFTTFQFQIEFQIIMCFSHIFFINFLFLLFHSSHIFVFLVRSLRPRIRCKSGRRRCRKTQKLEGIEVEKLGLEEVKCRSQPTQKCRFVVFFWFQSKLNIKKLIDFSNLRNIEISHCLNCVDAIC